MATLKQKGDLAELKVAADLLDRGCSISIPFGEDSDYDLIADFGGILHRVQVKFTVSDGKAVFVNCRSFSLTNPCAHWPDASHPKCPGLRRA